MVVVVSDSPVFLATFAEAADSSRLMVWETKLLVVTRLNKQNVYKLLQDFWTFSMMNTIFLIKKGKPEQRYDSEYCTNCTGQIIVILNTDRKTVWVGLLPLHSVR